MSHSLFAGDSARIRAALAVGNRASRDVAASGSRPTHPNDLHGVKGSASVTRTDFTDRLGLPASASDAEVLGAVDRVVARQTARAGATPTLEETLYQMAYSDRQTPTVLSPQDQALYNGMWA